MTLFRKKGKTVFLCAVYSEHQHIVRKLPEAGAKFAPSTPPRSEGSAWRRLGARIDII